ncbi:hypothetical protein GCM10010532_003510 [Dactylosporangium siamense]|uniref:Uncharacterized protein n=1 Tax=Dactylosporangium siamense TaxID=685454 RepID=A0A919PHR8_9ACTN|nr:hypothetical protein Dsi01nite_022150 [Dactylosporangium siamense]
MVPATTPVLPAAGFPPLRDAARGGADVDGEAEDGDGDGERDAVDDATPGSPAISADRRCSGVRPSADVRRAGWVNGYTSTAVNATVATPAIATPIGPQ